MKDNIQINDSILLQYFRGTLSSDMKESVESWIQESEENARIAKQINYILKFPTLNK